MRLLRYLWAGPASCLGLLLAAVGVAAGGRIARHTGVLEAEGRLLAWGLLHLTLLEGGASAITFGHVVLGTSRAALDATRAHERVHVRQYERWGPLFIPLYLAASLWAAVRGRHAYYDNPFEREAMPGSGGRKTTTYVGPRCCGLLSPVGKPLRQPHRLSSPEEPGRLTADRACRRLHSSGRHTPG